MNLIFFAIAMFCYALLVVAIVLERYLSYLKGQLKNCQLNAHPISQKNEYTVVDKKDFHCSKEKEVVITQTRVRTFHCFTSKLIEKWKKH